MWIKSIGAKEAQGKLAEIYKGAGKVDGEVAHVLKVQSLNPEALDVFYRLYKAIMFRKDGLSRAQCEMIAVVVSVENECHYWITHHAEDLRLASKNDNLSKEIVKNFRSAPISDKDKAMLEYAVKLTSGLPFMTPQDVKRLRAVGFSDTEILDINLIASYFNLANRIVDGLGVELEKYWGNKKP